jgi:hypothetical protein
MKDVKNLDAENILFVGDVHGHLSHLVQAVEAGAALLAGFQADVDVIVQVGDFGVWPGDQGRIYLDEVAQYARSIGVPIAFIGGNHEDYEQINSWNAGVEDFYEVRQGLFYIPRASRWVWGGRSFGALGGAFSVDCQYRTPWQNWWPNLEDLHVEDVHNLGPDPVDVLIGHDTCLDGTPGAAYRWNLHPMLELRSATGRYLTQQAVDTTRPRFFIHGHWHLPIERDSIYLDTDKDLKIVGLSSLDTDPPAGTLDNTWCVLHTGDMLITFPPEWEPIQW